jgi:hypothetical protein
MRGGEEETRGAGRGRQLAVLEPVAVAEPLVPGLRLSGDPRGLDWPGGGLDVRVLHGSMHSRAVAVILQRAAQCPFERQNERLLYRLGVPPLAAVRGDTVHQTQSAAKAGVIIIAIGPTRCRLLAVVCQIPEACKEVFTVLRCDPPARIRKPAGATSESRGGWVAG